VSLACHPVGGAILLRDGTPDPEHRAFAASLAADPDHTVVICDLAEEYPEQAWEPVVQALAGIPGSLRLVPWRQHPGGLLTVGEQLGQRLARVMVAADGHPVMSAGGGLFVPPDAGTGWYRVGPGRLPRRDSRRFPKPKWTALAPLEDMVALSPATTLRPLPSGAWLSPEGTAPARGNHGGRDHGQWLYRNVAWSHDTINVVLGQPGAPPVLAADVAKLWSTLPVKARQRVQFVPYGTSVLSRQELADALGDRVTVAAPLPGAIQASELGAPATGQPATASPAVSRPATTSGAPVTGDAVTGAAPQPPSSPARPERQRLPAIRLESGPSGGGARQRVSAAPGRFTRDAATPPRVAVARPEEPPTVRDEERETHGAAAQIVARPQDPGAGYATAPDLAPAFSAAPDLGPVADPGPDPVRPSVFSPDLASASSTGLDPAPAPVRPSVFSPDLASASSTALDPAPAPVPPPVSVSSPAEELAPAVTLDGVEPAVAAPADSAPADSAPADSAPAAAPLETGAVRVQPVPAQDASAAYLGDGLEEDRQWLQQSLSREFSATASSVARVLSQNPRLRGGGEQEVVADLVAVRLYITEYGQRIDDNVRTGQRGSHVAFARCVHAGLRRLPSHRGAARLRATLSEAEWSWYSSRRLVTEWAFCSALTDGTVKLPGDVDFLIWSATARRTSALAPEIPGQVVFLPGTLFKVLEVRDGDRREVLLREMSARETASGAPDGTEPGPLDEIALTGLGKAKVGWAGMKQRTEVPRGYADRFGNPLGLIRNAGSPIT
jgi:hypothetical protein